MDRIQEAVQQEVQDVVVQKLRAEIDKFDIASLVANTVEHRMADDSVLEHVDNQVKLTASRIEVADVIHNKVDKKITELVTFLTPKVQQQVKDNVERILAETINQLVKTINFPESSIPTSSIDWNDFKLSSKQIQNYRELSGIEDLSNNVELTLLDGAVVVENAVVTKDVITDRLEVGNELQLGDVIYNNLRDRIVNSIPEQQNFNKDIEKLNIRLDTAIEEAKKFDFKELEVTGETLLSDVLYTTPGNKRVGINTMDPSDALTVWDQETEVVIGKHKTQQGYIGTRRRQDINIGANNKVGITVKSDGNVHINKLNLMGKTISESSSVPGFAAKAGDIVLNSKPQPGTFIGWVCIDGLKWSGWGKIQE